MAKLPHELGDRRTVDFSDWHWQRTRRAGLLLMEAEMLGTFADDLANRVRCRPRSAACSVTPRARSAADYVAADRMLDAAVLKMRRVFAQVDVLVMPTTPQGAFPLDAPVPDSQADLTTFASLAGCPAVSMPMGTLAGRHADRHAIRRRAGFRPAPAGTGGSVRRGAGCGAGVSGGVKAASRRSEPSRGLRRTSHSLLRDV